MSQTSEVKTEKKETSKDVVEEDLDEEKGEEDKEECGWCKWMKAGGCRAEFQVWLDCVDELHKNDRDDVEACAGIMGPLWECMEKNKDYYQPQLESIQERREGKASAEKKDEDKSA
mmetsp:Transcript_11849/g.21269  ORF Transcript_11849/g.21269 Transcript_11849/m.21269 type:complete len:116 (-) Transcript_11849:57-404(-)|eukprot:CAMPEP_0175072628 /NCGR_PEP_ID=MMETSP0052_2-20121109/20026_1 /TAXON_ID=51329 ORGANISM="Polytomella parva, Strain SAG 63-3" /NCGR_SAMPLE_ID=MMETSP0052_2 /ASSEMBLY_ACC=CAM_ASM_000194 /LENGTH=115 /DNA_ID=CAMNT_0016340175 /DNA_START=36 /DNA_END=383 /DNA_ORIENTATION=+